MGNVLKKLVKHFALFCNTILFPFFVSVDVYVFIATEAFSVFLFAS